MYIILLLLMLILVSYGYSMVEPMTKKQKNKKERNRDDREADALCAQNAEDIDTIRDQLGDLADLKTAMNTLKQTIKNNDTKLNTLVQQVQTMT